MKYPLFGVTNMDIRNSVKSATTILNYPTDYSDREIQKMGRWCGAIFSHGMSHHTTRNFNFINIAGGTYHDKTPAILQIDAPGVQADD